MFTAASTILDPPPQMSIRCSCTLHPACHATPTDGFRFDSHISGVPPLRRLTNPAILKLSTFRFPVAGRILAGRKLLARTLRQPVPDAPNLLVERIVELLNSCHG